MIGSSPFEQLRSTRAAGLAGFTNDQAASHAAMAGSSLYGLARDRANEWQNKAARKGANAAQNARQGGSVMDLFGTVGELVSGFAAPSSTAAGAAPSWPGTLTYKPTIDLGGLDLSRFNYSPSTWGS